MDTLSIERCGLVNPLTILYDRTIAHYSWINFYEAIISYTTRTGYTVTTRNTYNFTPVNFYCLGECSHKLKWDKQVTAQHFEVLASKENI